MTLKEYIDSIDINLIENSTNLLEHSFKYKLYFYNDRKYNKKIKKTSSCTCYFDVINIKKPNKSFLELIEKSEWYKQFCILDYITNEKEIGDFKQLNILLDFSSNITQLYNIYKFIIRRIKKDKKNISDFFKEIDIKDDEIIHFLKNKKFDFIETVSFFNYKYIGDVFKYIQILMYEIDSLDFWEKIKDRYYKFDKKNNFSSLKSKIQLLNRFIYETKKIVNCNDINFNSIEFLNEIFKQNSSHDEIENKCLSFCITNNPRRYFFSMSGYPSSINNGSYVFDENYSKLVYKYINKWINEIKIKFNIENQVINDYSEKFDNMKIYYDLQEINDCQRNILINYKNQELSFIDYTNNINNSNFEFKEIFEKNIFSCSERKLINNIQQRIARIYITKKPCTKWCHRYTSKIEQAGTQLITPP